MSLTTQLITTSSSQVPTGELPSFPQGYVVRDHSNHDRGHTNGDDDSEQEAGERHTPRRDVSLHINSRSVSPVPSSIAATRFAPYKSRGPFRTPSSVHALQMNPTPRTSLDQDFDPSHLSDDNDHSTIGRATLSSSDDDDNYNYCNEQESLQRLRLALLSPPPSPHKQHSTTSPTSPPLVLLHVSILRSSLAASYPLEFLERHRAPPHVIVNASRLRRAVTAQVCARGVLVAHPQAEFELLAERLLAELGLVRPRVGEDGHFWGDPNEDDDEAEEEDEEEEICVTCERQVDRGVGSCRTGRWEVRFFAANGLMRGGAWSAAWREMERVDAEVGVWMAEDVRLRLERAWEDEQAAAAQMERVEVQRSKEEKEEQEKGTRAASSSPAMISVEAAPATVQGLLKSYLVALLGDARNMALAGLILWIALMSLAAVLKNPPRIIIQDSSSSGGGLMHHHQVQSVVATPMLSSMTVVSSPMETEHEAAVSTVANVAELASSGMAAVFEVLDSGWAEEL